MHYDRFLDIYLCSSRAPEEKNKGEVREVSGGYYLDKLDPGGYIEKRKAKIGGKSLDANAVEVSTLSINFWERYLKKDTRYVACLLDVNYVNGSISQGAAKPIPQLKLLMDWICDRSFVSKLLILGHGSGTADKGIYCAGHSASAKQLVTALVLNGLQKGNLQRLRPTAIPGALWKPDKGNDTCSCCKGVIKKGVFVSNKHHCRRCGEIVHDECSKTRLALEEALTEKHGLQRNTGRVRVCDTCAYEHNTTWAAPNPNARHAANLDAGLREITLLTCRGAMAARRGFEAVSGNDSFVIQSFAANFVKELRAKNIYGVRVAAANETLSLGDAGKAASVIDVPKDNRPPHWKAGKDGIPNKIYGWNRSAAEEFVIEYGLKTGRARGTQGPIDIRQFDSRAFLIKVSPDRSSLFFGLFQDDFEECVAKFLKRFWRFPSWTVTKISVAEGIFGMGPGSAAFAAIAAGRSRARNRMGEQMGPVNAIACRTLRLTPPPGYNIRFEERIDGIHLTGGGLRVPFKVVKIIETS